MPTGTTVRPEPNASTLRDVSTTHGTLTALPLDPSRRTTLPT